MVCLTLICCVSTWFLCSYEYYFMKSDKFLLDWPEIFSHRKNTNFIWCFYLQHLKLPDFLTSSSMANTVLSLANYQHTLPLNCSCFICFVPWNHSISCGQLPLMGQCSVCVCLLCVLESYESFISPVFHRRYHIFQGDFRNPEIWNSS